MSHNDYIEAPAPGFAVSAHTESCPVAAAEDAACGLYLVQFHPEAVSYTHLDVYKRQPLH